MGAAFYGEVQEDNNEEYPEEWIDNIGLSSHIIHKKKDMTDVKKSDIYVMVGNGQKMKYELKVSVTMKLQYRQTVKLTKFLYAPQSLKTF